MTKKYSWTDNPTVSGVATCDTDILNDCLMHLKYENKNTLSTNCITNCITEIPQDIKLELNNGVLTLKAGSKVYVPNGFEADGTTPKFDVITIESDVVKDTTSSTTAGTTRFLSYDTDAKNLAFQVYSATGTNNPYADKGYGCLVYRTDVNKVSYYTGNNITSQKCSLPLGLVISSSTAIVTAIDQVFNGFGYIGSTVYALPNVKCLIPNGRNEDGTLNNIEFTTNKILSFTDAFNCPYIMDRYGIAPSYHENYAEQPTRPSFTNGEWLNTAENIMYHIDNGVITKRQGVVSLIVIAESEAGRVKSIHPKQPFRAIDYSDKSTISGWGMPTNKYINLTLGASGTAYTAPANGWFNGRFSYAANGYYQVQTGPLTLVEQMEQGTNQMTFLVPIKKGEQFTFSYSNLQTADYTFFRFIYAESEI